MTSLEEVLTTGELPEPPEPEPDGEPEPEPEPQPEGRCEAETTVGGTLYRCALDMPHDGDHEFQPLDGEPDRADDSEKRMREATRKLDAENERHWKRLQEIMGEDALALVPCELCFEKTPGYRWDAAPNEETTARVRVAIGMPDLSNLKESPTERQCPDCGGATKVKTGSLDPKWEAIKCDTCDGRGYVETRKRENPVPIEVLLTPGLNGEPAPLDDGIKRDMFGTPETDPDYGLMPNMRQRPTDYWQTHRE